MSGSILLPTLNMYLFCESAIPVLDTHQEKRNCVTQKPSYKNVLGSLIHKTLKQKSALVFTSRGMGKQRHIHTAEYYSAANSSCF